MDQITGGDADTLFVENRRVHVQNVEIFFLYHPTNSFRTYTYITALFRIEIGF